VRRGDGNGGMSRTRYRAGVRFGLGAPGGLRSSSWKVWGGADSSVYIASREIGHSVKASLHPRDPARPGREWRVALIGDHANVAPEVAATLDGRVIDAWDSESGRLGDGVPLRQGFAVVLGRFSMGRHPRPHNPDEPTPANRHLAKVDWIDDLPPDGHAWQFTVLVTDAGVALAGPPGARAMQAMPVGTFVQPDGSTVWVVRHLIVITERMLEHVTRAATVMVQRLGVSDDHRVYRSHLRTTTEALRAFVEVAVTIGDPDSVG